MSQWGTVPLANRGMSPLEILRHYYPRDIIIETSNNIRGITESFPGTPLREGNNNDDVRLMQRYLNRIRVNFPLIPTIPTPNGFFGPETTRSVRTFQQVFNLPQTGIIDRATWFRIVQLYVSVTGLASMTGEGEIIGIGETPPNVVLREGSTGANVTKLQFLLNYISRFYSTVLPVIQDNVFRNTTTQSVRAFQSTFGLNADGIVGPLTWNMLYNVFRGIQADVEIPETSPSVPPIPPHCYTTYTVVLNDTLFLIANRYGTTVNEIMRLNNLTNANLSIGQQLRIPSDCESPIEPCYIVHTVALNDTLFLLARHYGTTVDEIMRFNNLTNANLSIGQQLRIPSDCVDDNDAPPEFITYTVVAGDTLFLIANRYGTTVDEIMRLNNLTNTNLSIGQQLRIPSSNTTSPPEFITHTVVAGDTLWILSRRFGVTVEEIMRINNLTSTALNLGQQLRIPIS